MTYISTSLLSVEENAIQTMYNLETAKTDYFHIDVMDGKFVPKNTEERMYEYTTTIKQISNLPIDVHFMTENVKEHIDRYLAFEPSIITIHYEACKDDEEVFELINYIKKNNVKAGISVKPSTDIAKIKKFLPHLFLVLVMTVEPGAGGQALIPETLDKVKKLKQYIAESNLDTYIQVDGGINLDTAKSAKEAGAEILVAGSAIVNSDNFVEVIAELKK